MIEKLNRLVCSGYTADPLEETHLAGIVFRLSSLTITKALIRLDSSSSAGQTVFAVVTKRWGSVVSVVARGGFQQTC